MYTNCYKFKNYIYNDPLFKNTVDATYIIHLENNGRLNHVMNQLSKYHPSKTVYICFNKGYKKCKKQDFIVNPPYDLTDAFINVFKHAKDMKYNNILVLEDDFIFNNKIKKHVNNVNNFLINHEGKLFQYYLGCVPVLLIPYNYYNYRNISIGCHSVIYSKSFREHILKLDQKNISDWDYFNNAVLFNCRYCYYKPLCYQLFTKTENYYHWGLNNKNIFLRKMTPIGVNFFNMMFQLFKMNENAEPGFTNFYIFGKINFIIILIILIKSIYK